PLPGKARVAIPGAIGGEQGIILQVQMNARISQSRFHSSDVLGVRRAGLEITEGYRRTAPRALLDLGRHADHRRGVESTAQFRAYRRIFEYAYTNSLFKQGAEAFLVFAIVAQPHFAAEREMPDRLGGDSIGGNPYSMPGWDGVNAGIRSPARCPACLKERGGILLVQRGLPRALRQVSQRGSPEERMRPAPVVERANAGEVAGQEDATRGGVPDRQAPVADQIAKTGYPAFQIEPECHIRMRMVVQPAIPKAYRFASREDWAFCAAFLRHHQARALPEPGGRAECARDPLFLFF